MGTLTKGALRPLPGAMQVRKNRVNLKAREHL